MIILTPYLVRAIYVAYKLGFHQFRYREYTIKIDRDLVNINNESINIHQLLNLLNSKKIYIIKNGEIVELSLLTKDGRVYSIIDNGELDLFNLTISGAKLFNKDLPIKALVERITENLIGKKVLIIGAKLGYYAIRINKLGKEVVTIEEDKYMLDIMRHNPHSKEFFENKIPYKIARLYYIRELPKKLFNTVIYNPPPFTKANRYYYSRVLLADIKKILKNRLIIDIEPPRAISTNKLIKNLSNKLTNLGYKVNIDREYLMIIADLV